MSEENVCAGCLATEVKMYNMQAHGLVQFYHSLIGVQIEFSDYMPHKLCWECAALVNKFNAFRLKCERAHTLLRNAYILRRHRITEDYAQSLDRKHLKLTSSYSKTKTLTIEAVENYDSESEEENEIDIDNIIDDTIYVDTDLKPETKEADLSEIKIKLEDELPIELEIMEEDNCFDDASVKSEKLADVKEEEQKVKVKKVKVKRLKKEKKVKASKPRVAHNKKDVSQFAIVMKLTQEEQMEEIRKRQETKNYIGGAFKCNLCYKGFVHETAFNNHMKRHDPATGKFECDLCKIRHRLKCDLKYHIYAVHSTKYRCKMCPFISQNVTQATTHHESHIGVVHKCDICDEVFTNKSTYKNHCRFKHSSEHVCVLCGDSFVSALGLKYHGGYKHKDSSGPPVLDPDARCKECDITFASLEALNRHIVISTKHKTDANSRKGCRICGLMFTSVREMKNHRAEQHPTKKKHKNTLQKKKDNETVYPVKCTMCEEIMGSGSQYWQHFKSKHPNDLSNYPTFNPAVCEICGQGFKCNALLQHHKNKHTGERPFRCPHCPKAFFAPWYLEFHVRRHSEYKGFPCDICGEAFKFSQVLKRHRRIHTGEKPYSCDVCGKAFTDSTRRNLHKRTVHLKEVIPHLSKANREKNRLKREQNKLMYAALG